MDHFYCQITSTNEKRITIVSTIHDIDNRMRLRITIRILFAFVGCVLLSIPLRYPLIRWESVVHSLESSSRDEILQILDVITIGSVSSFLGRVQNPCSRLAL